MSPPDQIVFLAFANAAVSDGRYLRNLREEKKEIHALLDAPEGRAPWQPVVREDVSPEDIFAVFQETRKRDRIVLFHYGGHATPQALKLRAADGSGPAPAHGAGLAAFLHYQRALRLVFLNGCETDSLAEKILAAGVPAVIGTSRAIDDGVARAFAKRFYRSLAAGSPVARAFGEAESTLRAELGGNPQAALRQGEARFPGFLAIADGPGQTGAWPWRLRLRDEAAGEWKLNDDPLAGIPAPPRMLPAGRSPFRLLAPFAAGDTRIFFGRGREIAALYRALDPGSPPLLLLYGATGVGKSSLLDAGLLPRLGGRRRPVYLRRTRQAGLGGDLRAALRLLAAAPGEGDLPALWRAAEAAGLPLLVILDQAEEAFTRPRDGEDEIAEVLRALAPVLQTAGSPGRLVLSFRKEWFAEVHKRVLDAQWEHGTLFLTPLDRAALVEVVEGPARDRELCAHFQLKIEEGLGEIIASALSLDRESALAPALQVLLTELWNAATPADGGKREFNARLFDQVRLRGLGLQDFLKRQLAALIADPAVGASVKAGLALDLLWQHTTTLGTADSHRFDAIKAAYCHLDETRVLRPLLARLADLALLTDPAQSRDEISRTRLAHDALGPLVRAACQASPLPGPRARRILENWRASWAGQDAGKSRLGWRDTLAVRNGRLGIRALDKQEEALVERSSDAALAVVCTTVAAVLLLTVSLGVLAYEMNARRADRRQSALVAEESKANRSMKDTLTALSFLNHGRPHEAAAFLVQALRTDPHNTLAANRLFALLVQRNWLIPLGRNQTQDDFHSTFTGMSDGEKTVEEKAVASFASRDHETLDAVSGRVVNPPISRFNFSDSSTIPKSEPVEKGWRTVTLVSQQELNALRLWTGSPPLPMSEFAFFPSDMLGLVIDADCEFGSGKFYVRNLEVDRHSGWDLREGQARCSQPAQFASASDAPPSLPPNMPYAPVAATPDGKLVLARNNGPEDGSYYLLNAATGRLLQTLDYGAYIGAAALFPDGKRAVTAGRNHTCLLFWEFAPPESSSSLASIAGQQILCEQPVWSVAVSPDGRLVAAGLWQSRPGDTESAAESFVLAWHADTQQPVIDPIRVAGRVVRIDFDAGSKSLRVQTGDDETYGLHAESFSWDIACGDLGPAGVPEWFCQLAEGAIGMTLSAQGTLNVCSIDKRIDLLASIRRELSSAHELHSNLERFGAWFLADRSERTVSPFSTRTMREFLIARIREMLADTSLAEPARAALVHDALLQAAGNQPLTSELRALSPEVGRLEQLPAPSLPSADPPTN